MILSHLNAGKALHKWGGGTKIGKIRQTDPFVIFFWGGGFEDCCYCGERRRLRNG
jgi:hypothetical protein